MCSLLWRRGVFGPDFEVSDAGQYAILGKQFLEAAVTLEAAPAERKRLLFRPTLALAGHGLELMLKASALINGETPQTKGRAGHDIETLWNMPGCEAFRGHVLINARRAADEARTSGQYVDVPLPDELEAVIVDHVLALGGLHGDSTYPLRYRSSPATDAPRTPFLVRTLALCADDLVKRPSDFLISQFRTRI
jgi:hypothetical protein